MTELRLLADAGFSEPECFWREAAAVVFGGGERTVSPAQRSRNSRATAGSTAARGTAPSSRGGLPPARSGAG